MAELDAVRERVARHVCSTVVGSERVDGVMDDVVAPLLAERDAANERYAIATGIEMRVSQTLTEALELDPHDADACVPGCEDGPQGIEHDLYHLTAQRDELRAERDRIAAERDQMTAGKYVPISDLEAAWRVGAQRERERDEQRERAEDAEAERDRLRAALAEIRDRHRRHGDRCGSCAETDSPKADVCGTCDVPHPCWHRRVAEAALTGGET